MQYKLLGLRFQNKVFPLDAKAGSLDARRGSLDESRGKGGQVLPAKMHKERFRPPAVPRMPLHATLAT